MRYQVFREKKDSQEIRLVMETDDEDMAKLYAEEIKTPFNSVYFYDLDAQV